MNGLFAALRADGFLEMCQFPYGTRQCERVLKWLRKRDPAFDRVVPHNLIDHIPISDRVLAYHFLTRATVAMCCHRSDRAVPYLMAFGQLSRVQFALIRVRVSTPKIGIDLEPLNETDIEMARQTLQAKAAEGLS